MNEDWSWTDQRYLLAVMAADKNGNLAPLIVLLREQPLSRSAAELVADLLERHQLKRWPSGQSRPLYDPLSDADIKLLSAATGYERRPYETRDQAMERVAKEEGVDEEELRRLLNQDGPRAQRLLQHYRRLRG